MAEDHFAQIRLFRELLTLSPAQQFCVDEWEADDVVATLARKLAARGVSVTCHSNDMDYLQLEANPLITINGIQKREVQPRWVPLYKALRGDNSDNISGIPGLGPKTWEQAEPSRSEEHTSELPSLMRISYDVLCLKNKNINT